MNTIQFETELHGDSTLAIPPELIDRLPKSGRAKVIVFIDDDGGDDQMWRQAAYEQFLSDDSPDEAVYDTYQ